MILDGDSVELFGGKKRASKQERKDTRKQIRKERREARKQAKQLRKEGKRAEAKAVRKAFRQKAKSLRREKGMGLLGLGKSILPRKKQTANSDSQMSANAQENAQEIDEAVASNNSGQDTTQLSEPRVAITNSANSGGGFSTSAGNQTGSQDTGQDSSQDDEGTDENNGEKHKKKSKKWLWIGGGIALLVIALVLFFVLKNKE